MIHVKYAKFITQLRRKSRGKEEKTKRKDEADC